MAQTTMNTLSLEVAMGCARHLKAQLEAGTGLDALNLTVEDYKAFAAPVPWIGSDRDRMVRVMGALMKAPSTRGGIAKFRFPAEWLAMIIRVFAHECNMFLACHWSEDLPSADRLVRHSVDPTDEEQLYALVLLLYAEVDTTGFRDLFEQKVGVEIVRAQQEPGELELRGQRAPAVVRPNTKSTTASSKED